MHREHIGRRLCHHVCLIPIPPVRVELASRLARVQSVTLTFTYGLDRNRIASTAVVMGRIDLALCPSRTNGNVYEQVALANLARICAYHCLSTVSN